MPSVLKCSYTRLGSSKASPLNPRLAGNVLLETVLYCRYIARLYVLNEKKTCNPFPSKADIERRSNFENFLTVYLWRLALHLQLAVYKKKCAKNSNILGQVLNYIQFFRCFLLLLSHFIAHDVCKNTQVQKYTFLIACI